MNGPRYVFSRTREEQFQEAYDEVTFDRLLDKGEICVHGWAMGECPEGICQDEYAEKKKQI